MDVSEIIKTSEASLNIFKCVNGSLDHNIWELLFWKKSQFFIVKEKKSLSWIF